LTSLFGEVLSNSFLTASLSLRPDIVVNSAGTAIMTKLPILMICVGKIDGCQEYGKFISPVAKRIGFGYWHLIISSDGRLTKSRTKFQNGLEVVSPVVIK
jgi:hypothetical protein